MSKHPNFLRYGIIKAVKCFMTLDPEAGTIKLFTDEIVVVCNKLEYLSKSVTSAQTSCLHARPETNRVEPHMGL